MAAYRWAQQRKTQCSSATVPCSEGKQPPLHNKSNQPSSRTQGDTEKRCLPIFVQTQTKKTMYKRGCQVLMLPTSTS